MNPFNIEAVHEIMDDKAHGNPAAKCGVDVALCDLMGRISGLPAYHLLGETRDLLAGEDLKKMPGKP